MAQLAESLNSVYECSLSGSVGRASKNVHEGGLSGLVGRASKECL